MKLQTVLLDIDGTLLDSNDAHADSWAAVLHRHGFDCRRDRIRPMIGMGGDKLLPLLIGKGPGDPVFERISEERTRLFLDDYLPSLRPTAGARPLVERMKADGLSLVVATSAGDELQALLAQADFAGATAIHDDPASLLRAWPIVLTAP